METSFESVRLLVRPPRAVVAYDDAAGDWQRSALSVLGSLSQCWGGAGSVLLPYGSEPPRALLRLLRAYDPDYLAVRHLEVRDLPDADAEAFVERQLAGWDAEGQSALRGEESRGRLRESLLGVHISGGVPDSIVSLVRQWTAPHQELGERDAVILPRDDPSGPFSDVDRYLPPDEPTVALDCAGLSPAFALMVAGRLGHRLKDRLRGRVLRPRVEEADLPALAELAVTGQVRYRQWALSARLVDAGGPVVEAEAAAAWLHDKACPFAQTLRGVGDLLPLGFAWSAPRLLVVGDTPADHALALLADRLLRPSAWLPTSLLDGTGAEADAVRGAFSALGRLPPERGRPVPVLLTSLSVPEADLLRWRDEMAPELRVVDGRLRAVDAAGGGRGPAEPEGQSQQVTSAGPPAVYDVEDVEHASWLTVEADPEAVALDAVKILAVPGSLANDYSYPSAREPDGTVQLLVPVDCPTPGVAPLPHAWQVEASLGRAWVPSRSALTGAALLDATQGDWPEGVVVRPGAHGVVFDSRNFGLVLGGSPPELYRARPRLRFPGVDTTLHAIVAERGLELRPSAAGRRARNAVDLWGGVPECVADLRGPVRRLLDAFAPGRKGDGPYDHGVALQGEGFVTFATARKLLAGPGAAAAPEPADESEEADRATVDRLLALGVLSRGLLLRCRRCDKLDFYPLDDLGQRFSCHRCRQEDALARPRWRAPVAEPEWFYDLNPVVRLLLQHHGDVPLLAADRLSGSTRTATQSFELELYRQDEDRPHKEVDFVVVRRGRITVGEAKSGDGLKTGEKNLAEAARGLAEAAQQLTADYVCVATSSDKWVATVEPAMRAALRESARGARAPEAELVTLEAVGQ